MRWGLGALGLVAAGIVAIGAVGLGGVSANAGPGDGGARGERYRELLAEELGITVEELTEAQTAARNRLIDEALAAGNITQEQAERLKERELGEGLHLHFGPHFGPRVDRAVIGILESAAEVLDLEVDELRDRLAEGESLAEIAASKNIDEETLKNDLVAALTEKINQAVADGDITQERADMLLANLDEWVERGIDAEAPFRFERHAGPLHRMR